METYHSPLSSSTQSNQQPLCPEEQNGETSKIDGLRGGRDCFLIVGCTSLPNTSKTDLKIAEETVECILHKGDPERFGLMYFGGKDSVAHTLEQSSTREQLIAERNSACSTRSGVADDNNSKHHPSGAINAVDKALTTMKVGTETYTNCYKHKSAPLAQYTCNPTKPIRTSLKEQGLASVKYLDLQDELFRSEEIIATCKDRRTEYLDLLAPEQNNGIDCRVFYLGPHSTRNWYYPDELPLIIITNYGDVIIYSHD